MQVWPAEGSCSFPNPGKNAEVLVPMEHASNPETDVLFLARKVYCDGEKFGFIDLGLKRQRSNIT